MTQTFKLSALSMAVSIALLGLSASPSWAQQPQPAQPGSTTPTESVDANPLLDSVTLGMRNSATLNADLHALEAQIEDANGVFGRMLPTVDLRGSVGRENTEIDNVESRTYNANSYGIEARQNIFSGFANQARYSAAHSEAMQTYFRYLNKANQIAFEASSSHIDVSRFQALTKLSEENLKYHQDLMDRIDEKVKSGVARQSDLEQARSRYTLALGNLATEKANTFSSMANYQRITDKVWPINDMGEYKINANFEIENRERLLFALNNHPLIKAANANIEGAKDSVTAASEGFYPRFDLRAKSDVYSNYLSTFNERQITSVDILATMNLYKGGADQAARNAAIKRKMRSFDDKLLVCRSIRQSTQTALFDVVSLQKKLNYFTEQTDAITKARAAYAQQFAVGRRSLLDLLSAENEYFQAQRALINIEADLSVSKLKLLASTGQLVSLFGVNDLLNASEPTQREVLFYKQQTEHSNEEEGCPASLINLNDFDLPIIGFDDALKSVNSSDLADTLAPIELAQLGTLAALETPSQFAGLSNPAEVSKNLIDKIQMWARAWESKDVNNYVAFYSPGFKPEEGSYNSWLSQRRERVRNAQDTRIEISDIQVVPSFDQDNVYEVTFIQHYRAAHYEEKSRKTLTWRENQGIWQIVREQNQPINTAKANETNNLAAVSADSHRF